MWIARILCSGRDCTEEREVVIDSLDELDGLSCECGYGCVLLGVSNVELV